MATQAQSDMTVGGVAFKAGQFIPDELLRRQHRDNISSIIRRWEQEVLAAHDAGLSVVIEERFFPADFPQRRNNEMVVTIHPKA